MTTAISVLYGFVGVVLGYRIPDLSFSIMKYKKGKDNLENCKEFLYSKWFRLILSILNGVAWLLSSQLTNNLFVGSLVAILVSLGLVITFVDIQIRIIPNELIVAVSVVGIVFQVTSYGLWSLIIALVCMVVMMVIFTSVAAFVGFGKVGAGDVKLAGAMGLALGYPLVVIAIGIMTFVLLVFILIGFALKKIFLSTMLPLAPFMMAGFVFALITVIF